MMNKNFISRAFLIVLTVVVLWACFLVFRPFLVEILAAAILVSIFYRPFEWLCRRLKFSRSLAALLMCVGVALLVIIPASQFIVFAAQESVRAFDSISKFINQIDLLEDVFARYQITHSIYEYVIANEEIKSLVLQAAARVNQWLVSGAGTFIVGTTSFIISLMMIVFTMFFFFRDGEAMLEKVMHWTPLSNNHDRLIFRKFRDVSYSTVVSTFVAALAQGLAGAVGFMIVGIPAFFPAMAIAFLSLIPLLGSSLVWGPIAVYLFLAGKIWQAIFLVIWGQGLIWFIDNVLRAYLIKGKAEVHPIFVVFSIIGGISLFGFWGIIFGPLIISLAVTVLHIYEKEFGEALEK